MPGDKKKKKNVNRSNIVTSSVKTLKMIHSEKKTFKAQRN